MPTDSKEGRPQTLGRRQTPLRGRNPFDGSTVWRAGGLGVFVTVSTRHASNPEHPLAVGDNNHVAGLHSLDEIPDLARLPGKGTCIARVFLLKQRSRCFPDMVTSGDSGQIPKRVPANSRIGSIAHRRPNEWPVAKTRTEPPVANRGSVAFIKRAREMVHRPAHLPSEPHEPSTAHIETILRGRLLKYPHQVVSLPPLVMEVVDLLRKEQTPILVRPSQTPDIR